jgi:hypothetical protein
LLGPALPDAQSALAWFGREQWSPHTVSRLTPSPAGGWGHAAAGPLLGFPAQHLIGMRLLADLGPPSAPVAPPPARRFLPYPEPWSSAAARAASTACSRPSPFRGPQGVKRGPIRPAHIRRSHGLHPVSISDLGFSARPGPSLARQPTPSVAPASTRSVHSAGWGGRARKASPVRSRRLLANVRFEPNGGHPVATAGPAPSAVRWVEAEARWNRRRS